MPIDLKEHAELVERRHALIREIERLLADLAAVNERLSQPGGDKSPTRPGTVKHAALASIRGGQETLIGITASVCESLGRSISKNQVSNNLRDLRAMGLVVQANNRWYAVNLDHAALGSVSISPSARKGR
jgi:hypothetical protein